MKKIFILLNVIACAFLGINKSAAQSTLLHYWNFNKLVTVDTFPNFHSIKADYSKLDTNKATILYAPLPGLVNTSSYAHTTYIGVYVPSDTLGESVNMRNGDSVGTALRVANPSDSMQLLFFIPTNNYKNINVKFISYPSSTTSGQKVQLYDYSTDSGMTFKTTALTVTSDTFVSKIWRLNEFNLSSDTTVNNNAKLVFRVRFSQQTSSSSGNNRFDNVTVEGDTITAPTDTTSSVAKVVVNANQYTIYPNPAGNNITISANNVADKTIAIYNIAGQQLFTTRRSDKAVTLDINTLSTGMYYINVTEQSGATQTFKFVKN